MSYLRLATEDAPEAEAVLDSDSKEKPHAAILAV